ARTGVVPLTIRAARLCPLTATGLRAVRHARTFVRTRAPLGPAARVLVAFARARPAVAASHRARPVADLPATHWIEVAGAQAGPHAAFAALLHFVRRAFALIAALAPIEPQRGRLIAFARLRAAALARL